MSSLLRKTILACAVCFGVCCGASADEPLRIGFAETDITPPTGFPMAGYYHERLAEGVIDPLKAKAIVFRGETEHAAIVVCDLTGVSIDLAMKARSLAAEKTGIPAANIVVSATHSHTAPDYSKDLYLFLADKSRDATQATGATRGFTPSRSGRTLSMKSLCSRPNSARARTSWRSRRLGLTPTWRRRSICWRSNFTWVTKDDRRYNCMKVESQHD